MNELLNKKIFYKIFYPVCILISQLLPEKISYGIINWLLAYNNKIVLRNINKNLRKILVLLPKCIQYFNCNKNIIFSVESCVQCGQCKIKDIITLKQRYNVELKVASGGELAKAIVNEIQPDCVIAVACKKELLFGIKEVYDYNVIAIPNIIVGKPCINTDVEVEKIENFINKIMIR